MFPAIPFWFPVPLNLISCEFAIHLGALSYHRSRFEREKRERAARESAGLCTGKGQELELELNLSEPF